MFEQIKLPYAYDALEPVIDALTVETHYAKHHATYTKTFNTLAEQAGVQGKSVEEVLAGLDKISDDALRTGLRNNGGGFYNHNLYFSTISPDGGKTPEGKLAAKIDETFGSFDALKEELSKLALGQFGSGWSFLSADREGKLYTSKSPNQDNPISEGTGRVPIMCIDVWEHAYYLKYKNLRADYVKALFDVIDWKKVAERYEAVIG